MPRKTAGYVWKEKSRRKCAPGSTRTIKRGKGKKAVILHICCPARQYSRGRCKVGTFAKEIGRPR